jgi:hypothetical protein
MAAQGPNEKAVRATLRQLEVSVVDERVGSAGGDVGEGS